MPHRGLPFADFRERSIVSAMASSTNRTKVVLAGATGFVGSNLQTALAPDFDLVCLTRSAVLPERNAERGTEWKRCDLFSLLDVERALEGADVAVYLVHSMLPSARLVQGNFVDLDLILADNFARAAQLCGLKQIIYIGGLISPGKDLSDHLASRLEVEQALGSGTTPLTALRAGLVVGPGGSSLRIVANLVRRLPMMILPKWTRTDTQPIAIEDIVRAVRLCLGKAEYSGKAFDLGGPDIMSYRGMLEKTAKVLGRKRLFVDVPLFSTGLSKLWVTLFGSASRNLVGPLIDSLKHPMVVLPNPLQNELAPGARKFADALRSSLDERGHLRPYPRARTPLTKDPAKAQTSKVRSVQRIPLPAERNAQWIAEEYFRWLPIFLRPWLKRNTANCETIQLSLFRPSWVLIEFTHAPQRSTPDRQLFYITGGALAQIHGHPKGRIEIREVANRDCALIAIHDFIPTLPWFIYRHTQALFHLWVMGRFARHLRTISPSSAPGE